MEKKNNVSEENLQKSGHNIKCNQEKINRELKPDQPELGLSRGGLENWRGGRQYHLYNDIDLNYTKSPWEDLKKNGMEK